MPVLNWLPRNHYSESTSNENLRSRNISKKIDILNKKLDTIYKDIYISRPDNIRNLDSSIDRIDSAIDKLQNSDISVSRMSELLQRINDNNALGTNKNVKDLMNSVESIFNDPSIIGSLFANDNMYKFISAQNYQYDMICKFVPKLLDALELKRDNVLCSDNFSKNFINPKSVKSSKTERELFSINTKRLENEYEFSLFSEKTYMNISKYGEDFIYIVPYGLAFKRLLKRSSMTNKSNIGKYSFYESGNYNDSGFIEVLSENYVETEDYKKFLNSVSFCAEGKNSKSFKGSKINLHFNDTGMILDSVNEVVILKNQSALQKLKSLSYEHESYILERNELSSIYDNTNKKNNKLNYSNDGLILAKELDKDPDKIDKDFNGCVIERLPRENIIPVYIGKKCIGYYYLQFAEDKSRCGFCSGHHTTSGIGNITPYDMTENQEELAIRYISSKISSNIDAHFINANKDLKEEIYSILRYNEQFDLSRSNDINVTFIPAEDIVHCYFELDEKTHRGVSDLQKSIVPAMLYILLYLTDIIGKISRSTDKRIYYVKQNVETNVARTMMNVVNQIKKGNMGMRQIESMNNIFNIVGKYNDYIIPVGQSGDPPIQFEVMNGQDIQTPTEIMDKMEEQAVNSTGTPFEMLNSIYQQDFAVRFTMSNTRFMKMIYNRQRITERFLSKIYTKVYNFEYNEVYAHIYIILPPPIYLTMTNNQQLFENVSQMADKIVDMELTGYTDEVKAEFKRLYIHDHLSTYINYDDITRMIQTAQLNIETRKVPATDESEDYSDY